MPDTAIRTDTHATWAAEHGKCRLIAKTVIPSESAGEIIISTVVMGVWLGEQEGDSGVLMETRVFGGKCDSMKEQARGIPRRPQVVRDAMENHVAMIGRVFDAHMRPDDGRTDR